MNTLKEGSENVNRDYADRGKSDGSLAITLGILNAVANDASVSQRSVAKELGIALGLANAYVKRCIKKGWIKVQQVPANRYAYYLTPRGFSEKSRLTAEYLSQGFQFFRIARKELSEIFGSCEQKGHHRVSLHGLSDLTEIALMVARESDVTIVAIYDDATRSSDFCGTPIVRTFPEPSSIDAVIVTDFGDLDSICDEIADKFPGDRIFAPKLLRTVWQSDPDNEV